MSNLPLRSAVVNAQPLGIYKVHGLSEVHRLDVGTQAPNHVDFAVKAPDLATMYVDDPELFTFPAFVLIKVNGPVNFEPNLTFDPALPLAGIVKYVYATVPLPTNDAPE